MRNVFLTILVSLFLLTVSFAQETSRNGYPSAKEKTSYFEHNSSVRSDNTIDESFENATFPPAGWSKINVISGSTGWDRIVTGTTPIPGWNGGVVIPTPNGLGGSYVAWMNYTLGGATSNDNWLVTPLLENVQQGDSLTFWMRMFSNLYIDNVDIKISTTVNNDPSAFNVTVANIALTVADTGWKYYSYEIGSLVAGGSDIYIGFREHVLDNVNDGNAIFLDLVKAGGTGGPGCDVEPPTNPSPSNGATNVPGNLASLTWTNGAGANSNILWFGTNPGSLTNVQSGTLATSWNVSGPLAYSTTYYWKVEEVGDTCHTIGPVWSFTTESDPNIVTVFSENFESGLGNWTITHISGTCDWALWTSANWQSVSLPTLPGGTAGQWLGANSDGCGSGTTMSSVITMNTGLDLSQYQTVDLIYDSDFRVWVTDLGMLDISTDGGNTWTNLRTLSGASVRNEHVEVDISSTAALHSNVKFRMSYSGAFDYWWCLDNIIVKGSNIVPVELTSFTASVGNGQVNLNWLTATETNNYGFDIERKAAGEEFTKVGFVDGYGTTTEVKNYNFVDNSITSGSYTYRLKQIDFDGTFEYSNEVEVDFEVPSDFSLSQNFPNPFNPSTKISFSIPVESHVTLKIFNLLGEEVTNLLNGTVNAGFHNIDFDASNLNSGIYFYQIEAQGNDGSSFSEVKKMMLTK